MSILDIETEMESYHRRTASVAAMTDYRTYVHLTYIPSQTGRRVMVETDKNRSEKGWTFKFNTFLGYNGRVHSGQYRYIDRTYCALFMR